MEMKKLFSEKSEIDKFENPFEKDYIEGIRFVYNRKDIIGREVNRFYSIIEFKRGNTEGTHKIEAKTFPELYEKTIEFCKGL